MHVVSLKTDYDNIKGESQGHGRLKVRVSEQQEIELGRALTNLEKFGARVGKYIEPVRGKKSNYIGGSNVNWNDQSYELEYRKAVRRNEASTPELSKSFSGLRTVSPTFRAMKKEE